MNKQLSPSMIHSTMDLDAAYRLSVKGAQCSTLNLGEWLPSLRHDVRPLVPGDLCFILADVGVGKSAACQNIACSTVERVLMFEMELPETILYERFAAICNHLSCSRIEEAALKDEHINHAGLSHIWTCGEPRLSTRDMYFLITEHAPKVMDGQKPLVVIVDYIGLMGSGGQSRYERVSQAAEELKVLAKKAEVIVVAVSQIHRTGDEEVREIGLHSAKDSSAIEASAGLLLGMWREEDDPTRHIKVKVVKNSRGPAGRIIDCNFDGPTLRITERVTGVEEETV